MRGLLCGRNKIYNAGGAENAYGTVIPSDLPAKAQTGVVTFRLPMAEAGRVPREAVLFLRLADGGSDLRVTFNGEPCESSPADAGTYRLDEGCPKSQRVAAFAVKPDRILAGDNAVRVEDVGGKAFEVKRADCVVAYGSVEECGLF
jgi:hypothetical protein